MPLIVGSRSYDLSTRALVVGVVDVEETAIGEVCRRAERLIAEGADLIEVEGLGVEAMRAGVEALGPAVAVAVGAAFSAIAADTRAALVVAGIDEARAAVQRGVDRDRIVVDVSPRLCPRADELALGYPLLASTCSPPPPGAAEEQDVRARELAAAALAVSTGCRLVRTRHVHGVRRVCDVMAAVLEARASQPVEARP